MTFHANNGWFFERDAHGGVQVFHREDGKADGRIDTNTVFDAGTWAGVVAYVSVGGEREGRFWEALDFHNGSKGV